MCLKTRIKMRMTFMVYSVRMALFILPEQLNSSS